MIRRTSLGAAHDLPDDALLAAFQSAALPVARFRHADHVRMAWIYLRRMPVVDALSAFGKDLRRFAEAHGQPGLYHETVTWGFLLLVNERMRTGRDGETWPDFAACNPDLLRFRGGAFFEFWSPDVLASEDARRFFVLPRRGPARNCGSTET